MALVAALLLLFVLGELQDDGSERTEGEFSFESAMTGVDGLLNDALSNESFRILHDSVTGAAENVEDGVGEAVEP